MFVVVWLLSLLFVRVLVFVVGLRDLVGLLVVGLGCGWRVGVALL